MNEGFLWRLTWRGFGVICVAGGVMMEPHGGRLVYNMLEGDVAMSYWEVSTRLEVRPTLGPDGPPIRNPYREIMSIAYGFFSPLEGFMQWNEVESVLKERRLLSGWLFPFLSFGAGGSCVGAGARVLVRVVGLVVLASCRGYAATCRWLYGGVLLTVTAAGSLCRGRGAG
jgi:hypothetical protein